MLRFSGRRHRFRSHRDPVEFFGSSGVTYISASGACRSRERLRLHKCWSSRGPSLPPALVVPGSVSASSVGRPRGVSAGSATGSVSAHLQRQSSRGSSPPPAPIVRGSVSSLNCPLYASVAANQEIAPLAFNNNMNLDTGCMTSSYSKTREKKS